VLNIKVCSPLKLRSGLTGKKPAICHYSYNLPFIVSLIAIVFILLIWIDKKLKLFDQVFKGGKGVRSPADYLCEEKKLEYTAL
jgi:hypothetical protein